MTAQDSNSQSTQPDLTVPTPPPPPAPSHNEPVATNPQSTVIPELQPEQTVELPSTQAETTTQPSNTPAIETVSSSPLAQSTTPEVQTVTTGVAEEPMTSPNTSFDTSSLNTNDDLLKYLTSQGIINLEQAQEVIIETQKSGQMSEEYLIQKGWVSDETITRAKAILNDVEYVNLEEVGMVAEIINMIPQSVAERFSTVAISFDPQSNTLTVAMPDPLELETIEFLEKKTRARIQPVAASHTSIAKAIKRWYNVNLSSEVSEALADSDIGEAALKAPTAESEEQASNVIRQAPISKIVSYMLDYAMRLRASDIHIEPQEERTRIRYRIDGILQEKLVLPKKVHSALVSRVKILSNLKIDEKRLPQDGRFSYENSGDEVDLRVSTVPTVHGEKVVMRLLKKSGRAATFNELGLRGNGLQIIEDVIKKPHGIILITGPTGSGKTTTLYSILTKLNQTAVNIVTLEDPVEYEIVGVNQVQVNPQIGLNFSSGLRSFLRQDPNIIMVGEIRDGETADLAIQASLTGHLVLSTLHTNTASGALPRLADMGAEPFLVASSLIAVIGQRVVRKICNNCKVGEDPTPDQINKMKQVLGDLYPNQPFKMYHGQGCEECTTSGYVGRIGVFEVLSVGEKIGKMVLEQKTTAEIEKQAISNGMITMKQDGFLKVIEGITTIEEVLRVAES